MSEKKIRIKSLCMSCAHNVETNYGMYKGHIHHNIKTNVCGINGLPIVPEIPIITACQKYKQKKV